MSATDAWFVRWRKDKEKKNAIKNNWNGHKICETHTASIVKILLSVRYNKGRV